MKNNILIPITIFIIIPQVSFAYIGPGLAVSTVVIVLGLVASLLLAILAIIYYPLKRLIKKAKPKNAGRNKKTR